MFSMTAMGLAKTRTDLRQAVSKHGVSAVTFALSDDAPSADGTTHSSSVCNQRVTGALEQLLKGAQVRPTTVAGVRRSPSEKALEHPEKWRARKDSNL